MSFIKSHHPVKHLKSFKYAFSGILHSLYHEANFRIQILITILAMVGGFYYQISPSEWSVLIIAFASLLSAEVLNTSIENFADFLIPKKSEAVRIVKDLAAGFVLINAVACFLILIIIFGKYLL
jgi:diacylglycerol kinase (ATP)